MFELLTRTASNPYEIYLQSSLRLKLSAAILTNTLVSWLPIHDVIFPYKRILQNTWESLSSQNVSVITTITTRKIMKISSKQNKTMESTIWPYSPYLYVIVQELHYLFVCFDLSLILFYCLVVYCLGISCITEKRRVAMVFLLFLNQALFRELQWWSSGHHCSESPVLCCNAESVRVINI